MQARFTCRFTSYESDVIKHRLASEFGHRERFQGGFFEHRWACYVLVGRAKVENPPPHARRALPHPEVQGRPPPTSNDKDVVEMLDSDEDGVPRGAKRGNLEPNAKDEAPSKRMHLDKTAKDVASGVGDADENAEPAKKQSRTPAQPKPTPKPPKAAAASQLASAVSRVVTEFQEELLALKAEVQRFEEDSKKALKDEKEEADEKAEDKKKFILDASRQAAALAQKKLDNALRGISAEGKISLSDGKAILSLQFSAGHAHRAFVKALEKECERVSHSLFEAREERDAARRNSTKIREKDKNLNETNSNLSGTNSRLERELNLIKDQLEHAKNEKAHLEVTNSNLITSHHWFQNQCYALLARQGGVAGQDSASQGYHGLPNAGQNYHHAGQIHARPNYPSPNTFIDARKSWDC
jgi:hypothetical protein